MGSLLKDKLFIHRSISYYLVPLLVATVALNQILLSITGVLAPTEGGGFGMFATVDSPEVRILSVEAVDNDGNKIDIELDYKGSPLSDKLIKKIKSKPDRNQLHYIATVLINSEFVPVDKMRRLMKERFRLENSHLDNLENDFNKEKSVYRFASETDRQNFQDEIVSLRKVKLQMWSIRFDQKTHRAWTQSLGDPIYLERIDENS